MNRPWFRRWGWTYRPVSWEGVTLWLVGVCFCAQVAIAIDRRSHSVGDTLYGVFPFVVPCFLMIDWIASKTSDGGTKRPGRSSRPGRERILH